MCRLYFDFIFPVAVCPFFLFVDQFPEPALQIVEYGCGAALHIVCQRIGEIGDLFALGELFGIEHHQIVIYKVFAEERRQVVLLGVERHRRPTGIDNDEQVVVENFVREQNEIVPSADRLVFAADVVTPVADDGLQMRNRIGVGIENGSATDLFGDIGDTVDPLGESGFVLGFTGYDDQYAGNGVDRYDTACDHHHFSGGFQQRLDLGAEECIDDVGFVVQTHYYLGDVPFLDGMYDSAGNVHVVPGYGDKVGVGSCRYFCRRFECRFGREQVACLVVVGHMHGK